MGLSVVTTGPFGQDSPRGIALEFPIDKPIQEEIDEEKEIVRWRYELVLSNQSSLTASVRQASFQISLDAAYSAPESVEAGWTLASGHVLRVPHPPAFCVAEFRSGRSPEIAASLSLASYKGNHVAVCWDVCR
jgi:hypothetical protein